MFRMSAVLLALMLFSAPALLAQTPDTPQANGSSSEEAAEAPNALPVMSEYRNVKLGMSREQVSSAMGKAKQKGEGWEEFDLDNGNLMTVRYDDKGVVKTVQLYFSDSSQAPSWTEVVGNAEIEERPDGSKFARAVAPGENYWVTMFQSKSGAVTTITLSR